MWNGTNMCMNIRGWDEGDGTPSVWYDTNGMNTAKN